MSDITIKLPRPYPAQQAIIDNRRRNNLLVLSRRWGKTTMTGRLHLHSAIANSGRRNAWSAPTWKLMLDTFEEHRRTLMPITSRVNREDRRIELINDSVLEYWSSDDTSAGRGRKYHQWVSDESQRQKRLSAFIKGSVRPCLADYRGELWILGTANGEGSEFHELYMDVLGDSTWQVAHGSLSDNPYIDPDEIALMRRDLGPELAAQELDSVWIRVSGQTPLVRKAQWDELYAEAENRTAARVLALDCSISGDRTVLCGVWQDPDTEHFYTDHGDVHSWDADPDLGEIDYESVEAAIWNKWQTGMYTHLYYDPYQAVSMMQRLRRRGVRCVEFTQNSKRVSADMFLRQCINDGTYHHPDHYELTDHVLNAVLKYANDQFRIVKGQKSQKVDLAVALSMALHGCKERGAVNRSGYATHVAPQYKEVGPTVLPPTPFDYVGRFKRL